MKAHEVAAPLIPVIKDEQEQDDNETIIIDNDIPFRFRLLTPTKD
jgi:hypothetical protein